MFAMRAHWLQMHWPLRKLCFVCEMRVSAVRERESDEAMESSKNENIFNTHTHTNIQFIWMYEEYVPVTALNTNNN